MGNKVVMNVVDGGVQKTNEQLTAMAEKSVAALKGDKQFQMEQQKERDDFVAGQVEGMTSEQAIEFKKSLLNEMQAADERETDAETQKYLEKLKLQQPVNDASYKLQKKLEYSVVEDEDNITPKSRKEYVFWFKAQQRKSARATLEMCRTAYEASKSLTESDFASFCMDIGYKDDSSTIRKFVAIGKVYPRLIDYAEKLPVAWTSIYMLTQIPADDFERCIKDNFAFNKLTGSELQALVDKTKDVNNLISPFKQDKKQMAYPVAKVYFTKRPDDIDFRLLQKALEEVQARLPIKFQFIGEQVKVFKKRAEQRYEKVKQEGDKAAVKPSEWDYGMAVNDVYKEEMKKAV